MSINRSARGIRADVRDKANASGKAYRGALEKIRSDTRLSEEGRKVAAARAYLAAKTGINAWVAAQETAEREALAGARRRLFAPGVGLTTSPAQVVSRRDAADRADHLTKPSEAARLLRRATESADHDLARAIVSVSWDHGWRDVIGAYVEARPEEAGAAEALRAAERAGWSTEEHLVLSTIIDRPAELGNETPERIIANDDATGQD